MYWSRRRFIGLAARTAGAGLLPGCMAACKDEGSYSVALLGDTHFDSPDPKFYHRHYTHSTTKARYELHLKEHVRNSKMWAERMPRLIAASGANVRADTAFALQMGDLIQGDCGNPATHRRMLADAFAAIKGAYGGKLPLVTVVGNHDIRGDIPEDGALAAFDEWQPPLMTKELGVPVAETTFAFRKGPDVFIVVDFNAPRPKLAKVKRLLSENADVRHTFIVSHGPVVPSGASRWFLLGGKGRDGERRELLHLLAARNAIALSGHTHRLEFYDCVLPEGRVTQFVANSVWTKPELAVPHILAEGAAAYGSRVKTAKEGGRSGSKSELRSLVAEYRPFMRDYLFADAAGHYRLEVSDSRVAVAFFGGDSSNPARTFVLR